MPVFATSALTSVIVQIICLTAIIITKLKHFVEETKHHRKNRVNPLPEITGQQQISVIAMSVIRRKPPSSDGENENNNPGREENKTTNMPKNNVIYNKNLIEVLHIAVLSVVILISLGKANMMKNMKSNGIVEDYSRLLLFIMDVSPLFLVSVILPSMIIARQQEMQKWIKSFFRQP